MISSASVSWRPVVGWASCAVLAAVLVSLLVAPPPRNLPAYSFPQRVVLADGAGTLAGAPVDIVEEGGWHLPESYRYQYLLPEGELAGDVEVLVTYYVTPRTDAQKLPELYATRPWQPSTAIQDKAWAQRATQHASGPDCAWLEIDDEHGVYLVSRVAPDGQCTSTDEQVRRGRNDRRHRHPWQVLSWPFTARPDVDQRSVWVRMTVSKRVDGPPRSSESITRLWGAVLKAFREQVPISLRGDQVFTRKP